MDLNSEKGSDLSSKCSLSFGSNQDGHCIEITGKTLFWLYHVYTETTIFRKKLDSKHPKYFIEINFSTFKPRLPVFLNNSAKF